MTYIGIDNGVSGTIGILGKEPEFHKMPTFESQDYTKAKKRITRIDTEELRIILNGLEKPFILLERPMVNPGRFKATISAVRAFEATLIVIEYLKIPYEVIDSKKWQKEFIPGYKGKELKSAGVEVAKRLFPGVNVKKDADGILIAEYARRHF